jgi:hypothetical protein
MSRVPNSAGDKDAGYRVLLHINRGLRNFVLAALVRPARASVTYEGIAPPHCHSTKTLSLSASVTTHVPFALARPLLRRGR